MTARKPWGGQISKAAVLSTARRIAERDRLSWPQALRRALAWARSKKGGEGSKPADDYADARRRGIFSPRDKSPEALAHFGAGGPVYSRTRGGYDPGR